MSYAPTALTLLAKFYVAQGGVNLGVVGDAAHIAKGVSYHLGKDRLAPGAYSATTARDKAGLTNAASAIDLGRLDGSLAKLWTFSRWIANRCFYGDPGYRDIREVIFWSPTRNRVIGWSALSPNEFVNDYGDLSHKTHTHISFYRDSEARAKVPMFSPYFIVAPAPEEEMILSTSTPGFSARVKPTANIRSAPRLNASVIRTVAAEENWTIIGTVKGDLDGGSDEWYVRWQGGKWEYTAKGNVPLAPSAPVTSAAYAALAASLTVTAGALAASNKKIADAKVALG